MAQPGFPSVGDFYVKPGALGRPKWTQPGPGFVVQPQPPTQYPTVYQGYPQAPFAYEGLYNLICGHWTNTVEVYEQHDPYTGEKAAIIVCPVCGVIQAIVEPAAQWWEQYYGLYPLGFDTVTLPPQ